MPLAYDKSQRTIDADGRMHVAVCNISKANVCPYLGREIPDADRLGLDPNRIYNLYRDPEELARGAETFARLPLLVEHIAVSADAPQRDLVVGAIGSDVRFEHPYLRASISVWTSDAIRLVESGIQEQLSSAYRYVADMTPGVSPDGIMYDGVMRSIVGNHVALVTRGRAGPDVVVADSLPSVIGTPKVKFAKFISTLAAILGVTIKPEQAVALDAAMKEDEDDTAYDAELDEDEKKAAKDCAMKELGKDSLTDAEEKEAYKKAALDKRARDSKPDDLPKAQDAAPAAKPAEAAPAVITQDQLNAAVAKAVAEATLVAQTKAAALIAAREAVRPVCGAVTCDSAEAVYKFALDKLGVALDGVPESAYGALFAAASKHDATRVTNPGAAAPSADLSKALAPFQRFGR